MLGTIKPCIIILLIGRICNAQLWILPEQIHLAYTDDPSEMSVTWTTGSELNESWVEFGVPDSHKMFRSDGVITKFVNDPTNEKSHISWVNRAIMKPLKAGTQYEYRVGSTYGWSQTFTFTAMRMDPNWSPRLIVFGDMGNLNAKSLPYIEQEMQSGNVDAILHIGDFAYDMNDEDGYVGDAFMQQIEPIAASVPYMTCPGNHEKAFNFAHYKNHFTMPGLNETMVYSFTVGPAFILSINTEVFYKEENQTTQDVITQYKWLEEQLQIANKPESRAKHPWLIVLGHRPMYCSNNDAHTEHCNNPNNPIRVGLNSKTGSYGLEDLFYKYGVDLHFYAHEHSYERLWPVYNRTVCNGTDSPYHNPPAPVHIITGSAGCKEGQAHFDPVVFPWSAFHSEDFGYTHLTLHNSTHLLLNQISTNQGGKIIDQMTLVKDNHGVGLFECGNKKRDIYHRKFKNFIQKFQTL